MPIAPERKNPLVLAREFRGRVTARTGITDFDTDSKADALISVFVDQIVTARNESVSAFHASQIANAQEGQLDEIGASMGLPRLGETFSTIQSRDQNQAFYVASGSFGDLNGASDIVIPAGTVVFSDVNQNELGTVVNFVTTEVITLPASSTLKFIGLRAQASGPMGNVGSGVLKNHAFTNYVAGTGLLVVNFFSVLNGRPRENDRNYRFRLSRRYDMLSSSNNTKLHLTALRVPGVLDTKIVPNYYGVGTVGVAVLGAESQSTNSLVRAVQLRLNDLAGPGGNITAVAATAVSFDIEMEVKPLTVLTAAEKRQVKVLIRRALRNYFRSSGIAPDISLLSAAKEVQVYAQSFVKFRSSGTLTNIFKTVYIRKGPSSGISTERDLLKNQSITLDVEEYADLGSLSITYLD